MSLFIVDSMTDVSLAAYVDSRYGWLKHLPSSRTKISVVWLVAARSIKQLLSVQPVTAFGQLAQDSRYVHHLFPVDLYLHPLKSNRSMHCSLSLSLFSSTNYSMNRSLRQR